ncbi:MAG: hypothetical protein FWC83_01155, partial [Alphaproteobacteria bacterium]|nr:hypothetical protein [Alphaproteobacteria bacterium]
LFGAKVSEQIQSVFKKGADGVIVPGSSLMIRALLPVVHDLFFNRKLFISIDMDNVLSTDWPDIFKDIKEINASGIILIAPSASASGKICGMLSGMPLDFDGDIFVLSDLPEVMEDAMRLCQKIRPATNLRYFVKKQ